MNPVVQDQNFDAEVAVHFCPIPEVERCSSCRAELLPESQQRRTSFGLCLCDDCLYS